MPAYGVYRRSKRRRDLVLVAWPILAENEQQAITAAREARAQLGANVRRVVAAFPWNPAGRPPERLPRRINRALSIAHAQPRG